MEHHGLRDQDPSAALGLHGDGGLQRRLGGKDPPPTTTPPLRGPNACSVQPAPPLTATLSGAGAADPDVRGLCGRSPVQDPDLRPALGGHLLGQVRL